MRIMQVSKNLPQNNSETVTNENNKEEPKKNIYISKYIIVYIRYIMVV